jgi:hypothetical protein
MNKMVKRLLVILFLLFSIAEGQYTFTADEVAIFQEKLAKYNELVVTDSLQKVIIMQQSELIGKFEYQANIDSLLLEYKDEHILILEDRVEIYRKDSESKKRKWYTSPEFFRAEGMAIIVIAAYIVGLVK